MLEIDAGAFLAGFDKQMAAWSIDARLAVHETAQDILEAARRRVLVRTGATRRSGQLGSINTAAASSATITFSGAAVWIEYGTRPHVIVPRAAGALHFTGPNGPVFAAKVHHPGTRPAPFLRPAMMEGQAVYYAKRVRARFG